MEKVALPCNKSKSLNLANIFSQFKKAISWSPDLRDNILSKNLDHVQSNSVRLWKERKNFSLLPFLNKSWLWVFF